MSSTMEDQVAREQSEFEGETTVEEMAEQSRRNSCRCRFRSKASRTSITATVGGAKPQTSAVALRGGKLPVEGEYRKGDEIELYVRARIAEIHFVDRVDDYGEVTGTERRHIAKPIAVRRFSASEE